MPSTSLPGPMTQASPLHPPTPDSTAVHEASDVISSMSFNFIEDSELTSAISQAMESERESKDKMS